MSKKAIHVFSREFKLKIVRRMLAGENVSALAREVKVLRKQLREHGSFSRMIGNSTQMRRVYQTIEQAAPTAA